MAKFLCIFLAVSVAIAAAQDYSGTNYNAGDSGRSETRNADGSVQGQYSYTDPNGKLITIKYRAGKDGYQVEGDHLPKAPAAPQHQAPQATHNNQNLHQRNPAEQNYNPFVNPNVPAHLYQQAPQAPQAPQHHQRNPAEQNYNPFVNPNVPAHLYQQAPEHHQRNPAEQNYNPFVNPNVPDHLYQQAPQHHQRNPAEQNYNPFVNPHVPAHLYQQAPQNHHQPQQQQQPTHHQLPAGTFQGSNNQFNNFPHPNSIPGTSHGGRGPIKVSVSQQPQGFTYNFETSQ